MTKMPDEIYFDGSDAWTFARHGNCPKYLRADLCKPKCEAVGKEHCWTHDRPGEECQHEAVTDEVKIAINNLHMSLMCPFEPKVTAQDKRYLATLIAAAQRHPLFTEETDPERIEKLNKLLNTPAPWETKVVTVDEMANNYEGCSSTYIFKTLAVNFPQGVRIVNDK